TPGPTLTPADEPPTGPRPPESRRPSVAELQARLRARASRRTSGEPPPQEEEEDPDAITQRGWPEPAIDPFGTPAPADRVATRQPAPAPKPSAPASSAPFGEAPTMMRPIRRPASHIDAEARTTLMSKEQLAAIVRAAA